MTDYNDGEWHLWNSRHHPDGVHPESLVTHIWHDENTGACGMAKDVPAHNRAWSNTIKFCVTKVHHEPRVIWVNEYPDGDCNAHSTEGKARKYAAPAAIRVAVRYVEAPE